MKSKVLLIPLSLLYKAVITIRHRLFDWGVLHSEHFDIPVVCIGNITVGGTGKTPMAEMIIGTLSRNMHVAMLSRGYGRKTKGYLEVQPQMHYTLTGDEPKMIKMKFPEVPVVVCEDRVEGIRRLRREHPEVEMIIMDDGFQHRHVEPKINIIMIDYTRPLNDDHMLPWGSLRDLPSQLYRANYFIVSKCPETIQPIERRLLKKELVRFPYQSLYFTSIESGAPRPLFAEAPGHIAYGADVVAMAGIGNPKPFLKGLGERYNVVSQLQRVGGFAPERAQELVAACVPSKKQMGYRNKLEFGCSNKRWLTKDEISSGTEYSQMNAIGFHISGAFDKILPIDKCFLMDDLHNRIRNEVRDYAYSTGMTFFDLRNKHGLLRDIVIRNSDTGEWMVLVQFHYDEEGDSVRAKALMQHIADSFPEITALLYVDNQKANDTYNDLELQVFKGNDYIFETMEDLKFKVGAKSFYQTNGTNVVFVERI